MNRYLVTGASGFFGTHLRRAIEKQGDSFIGVPRSVFMNAERMERFAHDVKPDVIINLAAYGNMATQTDIIEMLEVNYTGTFNLLQVTRKLNYKALIHISTSSVTLPHETFYSATKSGAERLCKAFADEMDKPVITIRPYSVYGEEEARFRFIPTVFRSLHKGYAIDLVPDAVHDWIHIEDVVKTILKAKEFVRKQHIIEAGTGVSTRNDEVVKLIEQITGKKAKVSINRSLRTFDTTKWECPFPLVAPIPLEEGLKRYYEWYTEEIKGGE